MANWISCKKEVDISQNEFKSLVQKDYKNKFNEDSYEKAIEELILDCSEKINFNANIHWSEERDNGSWRYRYISNRASAQNYKHENIDEITERIIFKTDIHVLRHIYKIKNDYIFGNLYIGHKFCSLMCAKKHCDMMLYDFNPLARPEIYFEQKCDYYPTAKDFARFIVFNYEKIYCNYCYRFILDITSIFEDYCHKCIETYFL